jgi:predicted membrane chloride channel (bestrophin family)
MYIFSIPQQIMKSLFDRRAAVVATVVVSFTVFVAAGIVCLAVPTTVIVTIGILTMGIAALIACTAIGIAATGGKLCSDV